MGDPSIRVMMGSGKESTVFPRRWTWRGVGYGQLDGAMRVRVLVFRKLVTTEISIAALSLSYLGCKLNTFLLT